MAKANQTSQVERCGGDEIDPLNEGSMSGYSLVIRIWIDGNLLRSTAGYSWSDLVCYIPVFSNECRTYFTIEQSEYPKLRHNIIGKWIR